MRHDARKPLKRENLLQYRMYGSSYMELLLLIVPVDLFNKPVLEWLVLRISGWGGVNPQLKVNTSSRRWLEDKCELVAAPEQR